MSEKQKVLIICHTAAGQMYLGVLLNRIWYSPILARTPEEGIHLAQKNRFALILYDGDVTDTDLRTSITLLRTEPFLKDQPLVVFITGGNPALNESLLSQGCSAVLTKPLDLAIVYGVLARLSGQPRTTPRIPLKIRVEIEEGIPEKALTSVNLSEGGIYLRTPEPLSEGSEIHIKFTLPHDTEQIALEARVVRTFSLSTQLAEEPGMGLQFVDIPQDILLRIRNFVQWEMTGDLEWKSNI
jgi:type IV pilus assembly protein PilZ